MQVHRCVVRELRWPLATKYPLQRTGNEATESAAAERQGMVRATASQLSNQTPAAQTRTTPRLVPHSLHPVCQWRRLGARRPVPRACVCGCDESVADSKETVRSSCSSKVLLFLQARLQIDARKDVPAAS
eukprot:scaffold375_cov378-Prasinococcus_capsulatus_cf.AAC.9